MKRPTFLLANIGWVILSSVWGLWAFADTTIKISTIELSIAGFVKDGRAQGVFYDIANQIVLDAGYIPDNKILPYPRVLQTLMTGSADISILFTNEAVAKSSDQLLAITATKNIVVGLIGSDYNHLSDLHGKTVAHVRQAHYDDAFDADKLIKKYATSGYEQSLKMLSAGRVEAIIGSEMSIYFLWRQLGYSADNLGTALVLNSKESYLQFSKQSKHQSAKDKIINAAKNLKRRGGVDKILNDYTGQH